MKLGIARNILGIGLLAGMAGCGDVDRRMTITSEPSGALVYLNGREVGRTPATVDFTWYGRYDVALRTEDRPTLKTTQNVIAPWWQWIPVDLLAELTPGRKVDNHAYHFVLPEQAQSVVAPEVLIERANALRPQLESGQYTRTPATPQTQPTTAPAK